MILICAVALTLILLADHYLQIIRSNPLSWETVYATASFTFLFILLVLFLLVAIAILLPVLERN
jgi:hypothetical protein